MCGIATFYKLRYNRRHETSFFNTQHIANVSAMSNRLESLSSKKSTGKPSLKFKPKVVERKSKEEREKSQIKQEPEPKSSSGSKGNGGRNGAGGRGGANSGRGGARGGRGGRNYGNTHVLSSGLLSSGTVEGSRLGSRSGFKASGFERDQVVSSSPTPEFIQSLKVKDKSKSATPQSSGDSDDEDDLTKIDMAKEYKFADEETILFPVRPQRQDLMEPESSKDRSPKEQSPVKEDPDFVRESSVKSENIETELQQILSTKADLESKISEPVDLLNKEESEKLSRDYADILETINSQFSRMLLDSSDNTFSLFQLPNILPTYHPVKSIVKSEEESGELDQPQVSASELDQPQVSESSTPQTSFASNAISNLKGQVGKLNIHKSGKITLNLGNDIDLDITLGVGSNFLQELVVLDYNESEEKPKSEDVSMEDDECKGTVHKIGEVDGKLIATPII